jgi:hypothetical protein
MSKNKYSTYLLILKLMQYLSQNNNLLILRELQNLKLVFLIKNKVNFHVYRAFNAELIKLKVTTIVLTGK